MTETVTIPHDDYVAVLNWNGTIWGTPCAFAVVPNEAEINPTYELYADAVLCRDRAKAR